MAVSHLQDFLLWCTVLNSVFLLVWWLMLLVAGSFIYRVHTRWFDISRDRFDAIHYQGVMFFKFLIILFNLTPLLALLIIAP